jgi:DtxR family Mn-dependent transcriptional regulator
LQFNGLVEQLGSTYRLTQDGREVALNIIRAHRAYERFLADQTGYPQDEWHARAELAEHQFKDAELDTLLSQLGNPAFDPHGDPIPTAAGEIPDDPGNQLSQLTAGYAGQIVHLEDEPPRIYQDLLDHGLAVGVEIYILESSPTRHVIWIEGEEVALRPDQSMNIYLLPLPDWDIHDHITGKQLSSLRPGEAGIVQHISPFLRGHERRRLMDLGLVPGTYIRSEYESPSGEPVAYQIRGALIALRKEQTDHIRISGIVEN